MLLGGLGSLRGAFLGSVLIGLLHAYGLLFMPVFELALGYMAMAVVLISVPVDIFGCREGDALPHHRRSGDRRLVLRCPWSPGRSSATSCSTCSAGAARALLQPPLRDDGTALVGQGAFYAGGAYSAALLLRAGVPLLWSILLGAIAAAVLAAALGAFCVRHTRIYFSMLTLAFGMLVYAVVGSGPTSTEATTA